ncbi:MAG: D-2-hydroxyacid dehydrogenase [Burkholderiales bacterium]|nr:D-2-hydroxyacid dehydrogenase [Burkholderiales bacterium]
MLNIVFLEKDSLDVAEVRRPKFAHHWAEAGKVAPEELVDSLSGADIVSVNKIALRAEVLSKLPRLRMIAVAATGTDNVDIGYCRDRGIVVSNIRNYAVHSVPEHTFTLILALRRNLFAYCRDVEAGLWGQSEQFCLSGHPIGDLHGSTLGIIGEGALGQGTAQVARGFGMRVLFADHEPPKAPGVEFVPLQQLLSESDVVTLHLPLTKKNRHLIGARELEMMKKSALLINTARGGLVDENALVDALKSGSIAGAGFDVLSVEPPRNGNVLLDLKLPNFILTPHIAWASRGAVQALADQLIDNIEAFVAGSPRNVVT